MEKVKTRSNRKWFAGIISIVAVISLTAACVPEPPAGETWTFRAKSVRIDDMQDLYVPFLNTGDEPYLINIGFRVKLNQANSAQAWVINTNNTAPQQVSEGSTRNLTGNQQAAVNFTGVQSLDVLDLLNESNRLEVVGVYTWAVEEDQVSATLATAANSTATLLRNVLNDTVAKMEIPSDLSGLLGMLTSNIGPALGIALGNVPLFGLGDDVLGGSMHIGVAVRGTAADIVGGSIGSTPFPSIDIPAEVPPAIQGGTFFVTSGGTKNFSQTYSGSSGWFGVGGKHTYNFEILKTS